MVKRKFKIDGKVADRLLENGEFLASNERDTQRNMILSMISTVKAENRKETVDRHFKNQRIIDAKNAELLKKSGNKPISIKQTTPLPLSSKKKGYIDETWTIRISDDLNLAAHNLSLQEERLILLAASKINIFNTLRSLNKEDGTLGEWIPPEITITAQEFAKTFNLNLDNARRYIREASQTLITRKISISNFRIKDSNILEDTNWLKETTKTNDVASIKITFTNVIINHMMDLKKQFLLFSIISIARIQSLYTLRLFMLLEQHKATVYRSLTIPMDAFNHAMGVTNKSALTNFANCRKTVIEPAIAELKALKLFDTIEYKAFKSGRKYDKLRFTINRPLEKSKDKI